MAEESFDSFPTPAMEKTAADSLRRHSTGKSTLKIKEHVPHYLRASTGSCHDLCKYGKHVVEKSQILAPKKKKKATLASPKPEPNAETSVSDPTQRIKAKPLPISKTLLSNFHEVPKSRTRTHLSDDLQVSKLKTRLSCTSKAIAQDVPSSGRVRLSVKISTSKAKDSNMYANRATMKPVQSTDAAGSNRVGVKKIMSTPLSSKLRKQKSLKTVTALHKSELKQHETNGGNAEQVVLRHQQVEEKKGAKGLLLNEVIEETASKLGVIQKSKVKVLVGAFETVISLQDRTTSATTLSIDSR